MFCYKCGTEIKLDSQPGRQKTCPDCGANLHCCRNCRFFDPRAHDQCREPQSEWVRDKEQANFCEYFEAQETVANLSKALQRHKEARKELDELFRKK